MKQVELEILSETTNCPVVRMPQRRFPGVVIQGDSLKLLFDLADEVCGISAGMSNEDLAAAAAALKEKLAAYVAVYEQTMQTSGLELPYPKASAG